MTCNDVYEIEITGLDENNAVDANINGTACECLALLRDCYVNKELTEKVSYDFMVSFGGVGFYCNGTTNGRHSGDRKINIEYNGCKYTGGAKLLTWSCDKDLCTFELDNGDIVTKVECQEFSDKEEMDKCVPTILHRKDGTTEKIGGEFAKYRLTHNQIVKLDELKQAIQQCRDMGILLFWSDDYWDLMAVNDADNDTEVTWECEKENMIPTNLWEKVCTFSGIYGDGTIARKEAL